jgi:hypothetical protein
MVRPASAQMLAGEALVKALRQGAYVIVMRHASSHREVLKPSLPECCPKDDEISPSVSSTRVRRLAYRKHDKRFALRLLVRGGNRLLHDRPTRVPANFRCCRSATAWAARMMVTPGLLSQITYGYRAGGTVPIEGGQVDCPRFQ